VADHVAEESPGATTQVSKAMSAVAGKLSKVGRGAASQYQNPTVFKAPVVLTLETIIS